MPYLSEAAKKLLRDHGPGTSGELNYALTMIILTYLMYQGLSYQTCNDIVGALDNCKDEFRRRVQHPYEDEKIRANGDVGYEEFYDAG